MRLLNGTKIIRSNYELCFYTTFISIIIIRCISYRYFLINTYVIKNAELPSKKVHLLGAEHHFNILSYKLME